MAVVFAALPGVVTTCLLAWLLVRSQDRHAAERTAEHESHRTEIAHAARALLEEVGRHRIEIDALNASHREQLEALLTGHRREVANLCQRIQAPQVAVGEHFGQWTTNDPPVVDLGNDGMLAEIQRREQDLAKLANSLTDRAEELAAER